SLKQYPEAIDTFQKSLKILYSLKGNQADAIAFIEMGLGRTYLKTSNFSEADHFLKKALQSHLQIFDKQHPRIARNYFIIAQLYIQQKNHPAAIHACQQGLQVCPGFLASENKYQNPLLEDIHHHVCIPLLSSKAEAFRAYYLSSTSNPKDLEAALESATLAVSVMEKIRQGYHSDHSKLSIEHTFSKVYETGLEASYTAWKEIKETEAVEKAFFFAEKAKAILLLSAMQGEIAKVQSPIPPPFLEKEDKLKAHLIQLDKAIQAQKTSKNEVATKENHIQNLQIEFLDYHSQYSELMQQLEQTYPNYYQIKYQTQAISIAKTQSLLQAKELLIQYSLYANQLFIFAIDHNTILMEVVKLSEDFLQWVTDFQKAIFLGDLEEYISIALQLYQVLFQPIESQLEEKEQLLIIPDGALHSLPFDALISPISSGSNIESFSQLPYLLQKFQVQYHYSATLIGQSHFKKQLELRSKIQDGFLGVAPVKFGKRATEVGGYILKSSGNNREIILKSGANETEVLVDLEDTEIEVKKVYELFEKQQKEAIALFYDMASKEQLLEYIEDYKHILLSTHGFSDKENAALSGLNLYMGDEGENTESSNEKGKLYISDVMNLQLKAELVVLSSCESGVGKLQQGEGMMALHRAFLYAGASNIIYSLFKVPQDSTSELVQAFFGYVLEGYTYATALRKAKLALMEDDAFQPIDWAGFALIGG
ncbi:MAG: CHAT domain-containing protein, partial [Chitinophagales bacterium]